MRELVLKAKRAATANDASSAGQGNADDEAPVAVGYGRKQAKSTAFFGPRKTPISCKIKRNIQKQRRARRRIQEAEKATDSGARTRQVMVRVKVMA